MYFFIGLINYIGLISVGYWLRYGLGIRIFLVDDSVILGICFKGYYCFEGSEILIFCFLGIYG